jgi:hypothetical protein
MKPFSYLLLVLLIVAFGRCRKMYEAPVPYEFTNTAGSGQFVPSIRQAMEGVYRVSDGAEQFGDQVAMKWTYLLTGSDTTHYLAVYTGKDAAYFNLEGSPLTDSLVLTGYWRKLVNDKIGLIRLVVRTNHKGRLQLYRGHLGTGDTLVIKGLYGDKKAEPNQLLTLTYSRPLNPKPFTIMANRGGGRTSDLSN